MTISGSGRAARSAVLLSLLAVGGCSAGREAAPQDRAAAPPAAVPVTVATVTEKSLPLDVNIVGTAEAFSTVSVHSQITGELTDVRFTDGDDVRKGQTLFTLDRRPLEAAARQARANLDRDLAQAANARTQAKRYQDLVQRGIATREQLETTSTNASALEATVAADRAALENAEVQLEYATIDAPIAGRTGRLMVHAGNLVRANDTSPLVVINQVSPIYVTFAVPEGQLADFKRRLAQGALRVEAQPPDAQVPPSVGRISFVDNAVDAATGTITMRATFPNDDRGLWPGQFVNVRVTLGTDEHAVVLPTPAVQNGQQGRFVFVVKADHTVEMRGLEVARTAGGDTVVTRGVAPGETVVTDGHIRLVPGSRVVVKGGGSLQEAP